jgi:arylsulfatase A-like enzyme/tetratricopeptide (TPR) repeat protein
MRDRRLLFVTVLVVVGGTAAWWYSERRAERTDTRVPKPVVLITIDTWRADRFSPALTPRLAAFAEDATIFRAARSHVPLTLPSHVSLMTGLLPTAHGVRDNGAVLPARVPRLATWLRAAGYDTAAFVAAFVLDRRFGLAEGFDVYDDRITRDPRAPDRLEAERAANEVADRAIAWLEARPPDAAKPFFLWVHFYDPHAPYRPPSGVSPGLNAYDAEVQYTDGQAGRVLDALGRRGDLERAVVVVAGDHGESLGDHGEQTHGMLLYDAALRVPVIVRGPGVPTAVSDAPIGLADLAPTILTLCAQAVPAALTGIDLFAVTPPPDREIYAETDYPRSAGWSPLSSLVTGRWKIIASSDTELFDLQQDPRELKNVGGSRQSTVAAMLERLSAVRSEPSEVERPSRASPEVEERLRALGYVSATTSSSRAQSGPNPARVIDGWVAFETILDRLRDGRAGDALPDARALAARFPDGQIFQATYARALQESGRYREALEAYRSTLARSEPRPALLHDLAVAARAGGDAAEAVKAERAAVALDPLYAVAHNGLGLALSDRRQWKEAEAAFAEASRLDPNHAPFVVNLANARRESSDFSGAQSAYEKALDIDPTNADAANGLGTILVVRGQAAKAATWFERALQADPNFVGARLNLGIAYQQAGRASDAAAAYRAVLAAPGEFEREREAARALLAKLAPARP